MSEEQRKDIKVLEAKLTALGVTSEDVSNIQERQVTDTHSALVLPGRYKALGKGAIRFLFNTGVAAATPGVLQNGIQSITQKSTAGMLFSFMGASARDDQDNGCGEQALTRMAMQACDAKTLTYTYMFAGISKVNFIIAPSELDRLDVYAYESDNFGTCAPSSYVWTGRSTMAEYLDKFSKTKDPWTSNEQMLRKAIGPASILRVVAGSNDARKNAIDACLAAGILEFRGIPIEDFIVGDMNIGKIWSKFVQPLGY